MMAYCLHRYFEQNRIVYCQYCESNRVNSVYKIAHVAGVIGSKVSQTRSSFSCLVRKDHLNAEAILKTGYIFGFERPEADRTSHLIRVEIDSVNPSSTPSLENINNESTIMLRRIWCFVTRNIPKTLSRYS